MKRKIVHTYRKILHYVKSHISAQVTMTVVVLLFLAGFALQFYVKNMYFAFLLQETRNTEQTLVEMSAVNLNNKLKEVLNTSCKIAIDSSLLSSVKDARYSEPGMVKAEMTLGAQLSTIIQYTNSIAVAAVVTEEEVLMEYDRYWSDRSLYLLWQGENLAVLDELYTDVMGKLQENTVTRYSLSTEPLEHERLQNVQMFHVAVPLVGKSSDLEDVDSMLVLSFRLDKIYELNGNGEKEGRSALTKSYLADGDGKIISHENPEYVGMNVEEYQKSTGHTEELGCKLDYFGWTSYVSIDVEAMKAQVDQLYQYSIWVYMALLLGCALLWQMMFRKVLRPLGDIRKAMEKIHLESEMPRVEVKGSHEIWQLAEHYNKMTDELEEQRRQIDRHYEEKALSIELRNKAEREALESQINAHFLCNTLTAINYDAMENGDYEVAAHLKKLSSMLAYVFSRDQIYVTLGQEIQWVEEYLYLQKFRLMDVFDYAIDFPQEYGEWPCCKLFLQPFVENSILHGFEGMETGGKIRIEGRLVEKRFLLKIMDNGCGMDAETESEMQEVLRKSHVLELDGDGIGIRNVVTRLRMYYGCEMDIQLETAKGQGTCFSFWLPLPEEQKEPLAKK